jgi:hypothetical protein
MVASFFDGGIMQRETSQRYRRRARLGLRGF